MYVLSTKSGIFEASYPISSNKLISFDGFLKYEPFSTGNYYKINILNYVVSFYLSSKLTGSICWTLYKYTE